MKIGKVELTDYHIGARVTYIPFQAKGDLSHVDCQVGHIKRWNDAYVFVYYGDGGVAQATAPGELSFD